MDAVTEVLLDRAQQTEKLSQMVLVSMVAHAALIGLVALSPRLWPPDATRTDEHVMVISLAGAPGPVQGTNPISNTAVQQAVPDASKARTETRPAAAKPEMVEPIKTAKPETKSAAKPEPRKDTSRARTPTQGAEVRQGDAKVETGQTNAIPFGGLSTGGAGMGGARTDFANFCCPEYLQTVQRLIYANTNPQQGQPGTMVMRFVIHRDGSITDVAVE